MLDPSQIETRYAKSGDLNIAYQVFGEGLVTLVYIPGWTSHVENAWTIPEQAEFLSKIAAFARIIFMDRRGTGLSDPVADPPTLEERMDDVRAVMDAAGCKRAAICGVSEGGPMAILFAATYPERTAALILIGTFARFLRAPDYPVGYPPETAQRWLDSAEKTWGTGEMSSAFAPERSGDPVFMRGLARQERASMSPGTALKLLRNLIETDVRGVMPSIRVATLVLHRTGDQPVRIGNGKYLAEHIAGAVFRELPGINHLPWVGAYESLLSEMREFLTGERAAPDADRILTTILFSDIVDSTARAAEIGDRAWRDLLARFYVIADDTLRAHRGRKLDAAGDGLFAAFDGPARAVRCGGALRERVAPLGVKLRVGVHTGECEVLHNKYSGIAVHLGARVAAAAQPGEVLVTSTVKDLVVGSGLRFDDLGPKSLKGVPEEWRLFRATA